MIFFLIILVGLYCGFILFLLTGTILGRKIRHAGWQPHISIIVAARNEGETIDACLNSLINLSYPKNKIEIIIMNDHSDDQSGKIIEKYAQKYNHIQHYFLDKEEKALPGKAGAVQAGIEKSKGEIIFLTDADCRVSPTWVQTLLNKFSSSVGLVGGFTLLHEKGQAASFWQKTQALDWLYLLTIAASAADMNQPLSWMGNNLAFRRAAYDQVGGYEALGYSLVEDFALINAIARKTAWRIHFFAEPQAVIYSQAVIGLRELYHQRKRWGLGIRLVRPFGKVLMASSFLCHLCIMISFFVYPGYAFIGLLMMLLFDFMLCYRGANRLDRRDFLYYFPGFELLYFVYCIILPIVLIFSKQIAWKNEKYQIRK